MCIEIVSQLKLKKKTYTHWIQSKMLRSTKRKTFTYQTNDKPKRSTTQWWLWLVFYIEKCVISLNTDNVSISDSLILIVNSVSSQIQVLLNWKYGKQISLQQCCGKKFGRTKLQPQKNIIPVILCGYHLVNVYIFETACVCVCVSTQKITQYWP